MKFYRVAFGLFVFQTCIVSQVLGAECVAFNSVGTFPNYAKVRTAHGSMFVAYPVAGTPLPIRKRRLADGAQAVGAVPGDVPMTFVYFDANDKLRSVTRVRISYVTQDPKADRFAEFYDHDHALIEKKTIPGRPFLFHNLFTYVAPDRRKSGLRITQTDVTLPRSLLERFCVDPGPSLGITRQQFLKSRRSR